MEHRIFRQKEAQVFLPALQESIGEKLILNLTHLFYIKILNTDYIAKALIFGEAFIGSTRNVVSPRVKHIKYPSARAHRIGVDS